MESLSESFWPDARLLRLPPVLSSLISYVKKILQRILFRNMLPPDLYTARRHIPQKLFDQVPLDFSEYPLELDYRSEMVLRKAYVLANDSNIDSPDLIRQLM